MIDLTIYVTNCVTSSNLCLMLFHHHTLFQIISIHYTLYSFCLFFWSLHSPRPPLHLAGTLTATLVSASLKWCSPSTMTRGPSWRWTQETRQAHHSPSHLEHHWNTDKNCTRTCRTHTSDRWNWMGRIACMEQNRTQVCADYVITNCYRARSKVLHIFYEFSNAKSGWLYICIEPISDNVYIYGLWIRWCYVSFCKFVLNTSIYVRMCTVYSTGIIITCVCIP